MVYDYLIVGMGWAGTMVAHALIKDGYKLLIFDNDQQQAAWKHSAAIINPYNMRTQEPLSDINGYLSISLNYYQTLNKEFNIDIVSELSLNVLSIQTDNEANSQKKVLLNQNAASFFNKGVGLINQLPIYSIQHKQLINAMHERIYEKATVIKETFIDINLKNNIQDYHYNDFIAKKVIFTRGAFEQENALFDKIKFTANRGDVLYVHLPNLPRCSAYEFGLRLVPMKDQIFWLGSNHLWHHALQPDEVFYDKATKLLATYFSDNYRIVKHSVGWRPTTAGQQVVMMEHDEKKNVFIWNGLGTKGFSKGPYYLKDFLNLVKK